MRKQYSCVIAEIFVEIDFTLIEVFALKLGAVSPKRKLI